MNSRLLASVAMGAALAVSVGAVAFAESDADLAVLAAAAGPPTSATPTSAATAPGGGYDASQIPTGGNMLSRMIDYYKLEWGQAGPPADPNALPGRRTDYPPQPVTQPPYPFTEWPYGGATLLGASRPNAVDSPLMVALAPTGLGKLMQDAHIQAYGWVEVGANLSTSHVQGGNAPAGYDYNPNTIQMDQTVLYVERVPDTVQRDHIDWGFRISGIYGVDYRYTISDGFGSDQLTKSNNNSGYDFPMLYAEVYVPQVAKGLLIRAGRFISVPDIEAQLAPNNYMYSHSMTYTFDNFTNTGVLGTLAVTKNLFLQAGVVIGTDTFAGNDGVHKTNPFPNPIYPNATFLKDPGARPSFTGCIRYQSDSARDDLYVCMNGINSGEWGYNNLQWKGFTYYHKFTDKFHLAMEVYNVHESGVPNVNNPEVQTINANGGTPFSGPSFRFNAPDEAQCKDHNTLTCRANVQAELAYWNYQFSPLDNLSLRTEYFNDYQGQRTGVATAYEGVALGVQHWLSPQIELRPEIAYYRADSGDAFNGNGNHGNAPNRQQETVLSGDIIAHF
ncbi:outer membrane beta-barrel protein [Caulobacter sp. S45]|uniref:outer membrane beta-barrel protein n=1 Tax=Caulobacter sp. S45 TaxID=1641861 RepID=UPI00157563BA|nr:outer membrane beta-barrel protein [Caulobacter sp. S45]